MGAVEQNTSVREFVELAVKQCPVIQLIARRKFMKSLGRKMLEFFSRIADSRLCLILEHRKILKLENENAVDNYQSLVAAHRKCRHSRHRRNGNYTATQNANRMLLSLCIYRVFIISLSVTVSLWLSTLLREIPFASK